jgi:hypothetical protein
MIVAAGRARAKCLNAECGWSGEPDSAAERELAKASA